MDVQGWGVVVGDGSSGQGGWRSKADRVAAIRETCDTGRFDTDINQSTVVVETEASQWASGTTGGFYLHPAGGARTHTGFIVMQTFKPQTDIPLKHTEHARWGLDIQRQPLRESSECETLLHYIFT